MPARCRTTRSHRSASPDAPSSQAWASAFERVVANSPNAEVACMNIEARLVGETAALSLAGVRKQFGARTALDGVDLAVSPGEVFALLGPNGAGKTTTINLILGFLRAD